MFYSSCSFMHVHGKNGSVLAKSTMLLIYSVCVWRKQKISLCSKHSSNLLCIRMEEILCISVDIFLYLEATMCLHPLFIFFIYTWRKSLSVVPTMASVHFMDVWKELFLRRLPLVPSNPFHVCVEETLPDEAYIGGRKSTSCVHGGNPPCFSRYS